MTPAQVARAQAGSKLQRLQAHVDAGRKRVGSTVEEDLGEGGGGV